MALHPSHVLICRNDNIGDVVLTLPITSWLKKAFPGVRISFMVRGYAAAVPRACATVDEVIEVETVEPDMVGWFRKSGIDTVIFAQPDMLLNRRLAIAAFKAGIRNRVGNARQKLYMAIFCNRRVRFSKRTLPAHESQFNFEFLRPFGLNTVPGLDAIGDMYRWRVPANAKVAGLLSRHPFNLVIHPKSNGHGREWPATYFLALAQALRSQADIHLWVTGSADEGKWLREHVPALFDQPNVCDLCGALSLAELTCFIQGADGLVASGTGPLHLSAALGQNTLGLFPPTRPMHPGRWAPVGPRASFLASPVPCEGCSERQGPSCPCMEWISPQAVTDRVLEWHNAAVSKQEAFFDVHA
jgi:ADP-heptose:LPS heptosyltransferase